MDNHDEFTDEEATWDPLFPISTPSAAAPTFSAPRGSCFGLDVGEFNLNSAILVDNMSFMDILRCCRGLAGSGYWRWRAWWVVLSCHRNKMKKLMRSKHPMAMGSS